MRPAAPGGCRASKADGRAWARWWIARARSADRAGPGSPPTRDMLQAREGPRVGACFSDHRPGAGDRRWSSTKARGEGQVGGSRPAQIPGHPGPDGRLHSTISRVCRGVGEEDRGQADRPGFGGVTRPLRETSHWCRGSCARRSPPTRKQALLSRELATVSTAGCRIAVDLEAFRRREPRLGSGLAVALWTELEFHRPPAAAFRRKPRAPRPPAGEVAEPWARPLTRLGAYLAKVPRGPTRWRVGRG